MKLIDFDELNLLIGLLIGEAAGEDLIGKLDVACVVRNRKNDKRWPNTWQGVILQDQQFSCFNGIPRDAPMDEVVCEKLFRPWRPEIWWRECRFVAFGILGNWCSDTTKGANHYHADYIKKPYWAVETPLFKHGKHLFYKL